MPVYSLNQSYDFPPTSEAEPDGLLAVGGDLSAGRLLTAYSQGIFPWYSDDSPILWWSPAPRMVLIPSAVKISKSMRQVLRSKRFRVSFDTAFTQVIYACGSSPRPGQDGTWLGRDMMEAYTRLHELGYAHSVEVWLEDELVGGLYGIAIGKVFCGESMFAKASNASKVGFISLVKGLERMGFAVVDCQIYTDHLASLGAEEIEREEFERMLERYIPEPSLNGKWTKLAELQADFEK